MKKEITIVHLYPKEMNIYGDRGNIITLIKRLQWRNIKVKIVNIGVGDTFDFRKADIVFAGGGQDRGQEAIGPDLLKKSDSLHLAAERGVVMLAICGTYQLFGRGFTTLQEKTIAGIGIFNASTIGSSKRLIGNVVAKSFVGQLVGFENHSGQTFLDNEQQSLGIVKKGFGNNGKTGEEGAVYNNVFGTYLHGPLLPKNPKFADYLILQAMRAKYNISKLSKLNDSLEQKAQFIASKRS